MSYALLFGVLSAASTVPVVMGPSAALSPFVLEAARKEISVIYGQSSVALVWNVEVEAGVAPRLVVLFRDAESFPVKTDRQALGLALLSHEDEVPDTRVLVVFLDRLESLLGCACPLARGRALGRVIAHEMGHSLQYAKLHSSEGLMRAHIPRVRWSAPNRRDFFFAPEDEEQIHKGLRRTGRVPAPPETNGGREGVVGTP